MNIEKINELFKCKFCNEIYKEPIILTCGHKICKKDSVEILVENKSAEFKFQQMLRCHVCHESMNVPENGFPVDKDFNIFANMTGFKGIDFGDKYKCSKESIDSFKLDIEELKFLKCHPGFYAAGHFEDLRKLIEDERLQLLDKINTYYHGLLEEVNTIEKNNKSAEPFDVLALNHSLIKIEKEIELFESSFERLSSEIDCMKVNEENWEKITFESNYQKLKLSQILKCYQDSTLKNKKCTFVSKVAGIEKILAFTPSFKYEDCQIKDNSAQGFIRFSMTDFKNFSKRKDSSFKTEQFHSNGYKWFLKLRNLDEHHLCWTLHCDLDDWNKVLNCTNRFEIINIRDPVKNESRRLKLTFKNDGTGHGIKKFISFQELFKKGFYDEANDSIHINYYVKLNDVQLLLNVI